MKIALYYNLAFGGAKRVVMDHAKGLAQKGHTVDLYTLNIEHDVFDPSPYCKNVYSYQFSSDAKVPLLGRLIRDYKNFVTLRNLHKKIAMDINKKRYDAVLVHPDYFTQAPYLLRYLKIKSYYYCQEPLRIGYEYSMRLKIKINILKKLYEELTRYYRKKIDRENVRSATHTIASCYHIRERMIESYEVFPRVIYCAVDHTVFKPKNIKKKNQVFYVGSTAITEDGYDLVRDAIALIPKRIRPTLHIISWKKENGERLSEDELVAIYNQSIVSVCSSRFETFGLVPLESMSCGVPVIATKVSGHRETVLDNKSGFLVDFSPKEIAEKIEFFIKNPSVQKQFGRNARKWIVDNWTWDKQIDALEEFLSIK